MTEIISNQTINETHAELHCGEFPDLEKMKVIIINGNGHCYFHCFKDWNYYLGGVSTLVTASFGVLANFLSLVILSKG